MSYEDIINFIYYLEDKVDPVFAAEVRPRVSRMVSKLEKLK